jgi:phosphoserine aminotransferase
MIKPTLKPANPNFSSGPCSKRPGYRLASLPTATLGRSHRAPIGKQALERCCTDTARLLGLPEGYRVGVVAGSDTGAMEMAMWSLLGPRPVDVLAWESFGEGWVGDITEQLRLKDVNVYRAEYGELPDLTQVDPSHDIVFTWNGTTSGVCVPNGDWIASDREGLTLCDATSAVFAMDLPWDRLDVITFSWQKVLGGEGAHGMLILSPRAVARLESYTPPWPMPKLFRMTAKGKLVQGIFEGSTINTPSMLCVADSLGGVPVLIARSRRNLALLESFVARHDWIHFLAHDPATRSNTSVCMTVDLDAAQLKRMLKLLEDEAVAYDIASYRDAPEGIRIWCGSTVESSDLEALLPWLEWAWQEVRA